MEQIVTRDCRYFAGLYLWLHIVVTALYALTRTDFYYPLATVAVAICGISLAFFQPYKLAAHNAIGTSLIFFLVIGYSSAMAGVIASAQTVVKSFHDTSVLMMVLSFLVPLFYFVRVIVYWLVARKKLPQKCFCRLMHRNPREEEQQLLVNSLPDRIVHPEQYGSLHDPCTNVSRW